MPEPKLSRFKIITEFARGVMKMEDNMRFLINDETLQATTDCEKGFSCLNGKIYDLCKVESCINEKVHFIKCANDGYCTYQDPFGYDFVCACPTRKEIYNKYKI